MTDSRHRPGAQPKPPRTSTGKGTKQDPVRPKRVQPAGSAGAHPAYGEPADRQAPQSPAQPEEDYGGRGLHRRAGTYEATHAPDGKPSRRRSAPKPPDRGAT